MIRHHSLHHYPRWICCERISRQVCPGRSKGSIPLYLRKGRSDPEKEIRGENDGEKVGRSERFKRKKQKKNERRRKRTKESTLFEILRGFFVFGPSSSSSKTAAAFVISRCVRFFAEPKDSFCTGVGEGAGALKADWPAFFITLPKPLPNFLFC